MSVKFGSARIDENGNAMGGAAGDQTGREVSTQSYYVHKKGWRVFRCVDPLKAEKVAQAMERACANDNIGYDQGQRSTLYNAAQSLGFDPAKVKTKVETDCSALVRVCLAFSGINCPNFRTTDQASVMLKTGQIVEMVGSKYTTRDDYLKRGDILVTPVQGHTVVALSSGSKAGSEPALKVYALGDRLLKNGSTGSDVEELQRGLISLGFSCGSWGVDGDFGDGTEAAVRAFQLKNGLEIDGQFGAKSYAAFKAALNAPTPDNGSMIRIVGGNCYLRSEPNRESEIRGVVHEGEIYTLLATSPEGWHRINVSGVIGWVSGKYSRIEG